MFTLFRRSIKAVLYSALEIITAVVLLNYSLKWFLLFWFIHTIYYSAFSRDAMRSLTRTYNLANECKIMAIMAKVGVSPEEVTEIYNNMLKKMSPEHTQYLEDDFKVAAGGSL